MNINSFNRVAVVGAVVMIAAALRAESPAATPTTAPATNPATAVIKGNVKMSGDLSIAKPDLTHIVVYLGSDPTLDKAPHVLDHATIEQRQKAFVPNFAVIPLGTLVEFPNWDNFDHNVFSRSKAAPAFDLDRYPRGQSKSRTFDKVGIVQVFCNIHPSMRAMIYVTPNVYYARCDADGNFSIPNVPAGSYDLTIWNDRCGETHLPVVVSGNGPPPIAATISETRRDTIDNNLKPGDGGYGVERGLGVKREKLDLPVVTDCHPAIDPPK